MDLEIEHDPSSRFVDYTNATPFETLTSVIEDVLRKWNLADKGIRLLFLCHFSKECAKQYDRLYHNVE